MPRLFIHPFGAVLPALVAVLLQLTPLHALAADRASDVGEIPAYVLQHVELTPGATGDAG